LEAEGQRQIGIWVRYGGGKVRLFGGYAKNPQKNNAMPWRDPQVGGQLIGGGAQAHSHWPITNVSDGCRGMFVCLA
jgi:hypothetical protein